MLVEAVELHVVEMGLVNPFETSFGRQVNRRAIIISAYAEGLVGWGECVAGAGPWYSEETIETAWHILSDYLVPILLAHPVSHPAELPRLWHSVRGHSMAKASLEQAIWDIYAQSRNEPLSQTLGGVKQSVGSGISVGIQEDLSTLFELIESYVEQGYRRIKLKIKPGWDLHVLNRVRERFEEVPLTVDANAAYTRGDIPLFRKLDGYNLVMIEQPFAHDDLMDHATLQQQLDTVVCLDESINSLTMARQAIQLGSCKTINIKLGRIGGLWNAIELHDLCWGKSLPVWCGGMLETGIGRAHNVALASLPGFSLPNDIAVNNRYYRDDLVDPVFTLNSDGTLTVPNKPGLGVQVDRERLADVTVKRETFPGKDKLERLKP